MAGSLAAPSAAVDVEALGALSQAKARSVWENCSCGGGEYIGRTSHSGGLGHALGLKYNVV